MKPSLGRIVLVRNFAKPGNESPAMITRVWNDSCINVTVFPDCQLPFVLTSVVRDDNMDTPNMAWRWPPRVE